MSVQTLSLQQINSFDCPCNITGAITGTTSINFKRFNNIIYLSIPALTAAVGVAGPTIIYTPTVTIPSQYDPNAGIVRFLSAFSSTAPVQGQMITNNTLTSFSFTLAAGGNYAATSGILDNTLIWNASN